MLMFFTRIKSRVSNLSQAKEKKKKTKVQKVFDQCTYCSFYILVSFLAVVRECCKMISKLPLTFLELPACCCVKAVTQHPLTAEPLGIANQGSELHSLNRLIFPKKQKKTRGSVFIMFHGCCFKWVVHPSALNWVHTERLWGCRH